MDILGTIMAEIVAIETMPIETIERETGEKKTIRTEIARTGTVMAESMQTMKAEITTVDLGDSMV
jgi:hypothetical protein